jgi:predicted DNA-binding transcriptional regulator AlpA
MPMPDPQPVSKPIDPDLITREAAAAMLGCGIRKIDRLATLGRIPPPYRFGDKCVRFSRRDIEAVLADGTALERSNKRKTAAENSPSRDAVTA